MTSPHFLPSESTHVFDHVCPWTVAVVPLKYHNLIGF